MTFASVLGVDFKLYLIEDTGTYNAFNDGVGIYATGGSFILHMQNAQYGSGRQYLFDWNGEVSTRGRSGRQTPWSTIAWTKIAPTT